jgi:hypothetical protein
MQVELALQSPHDHGRITGRGQLTLNAAVAVSLPGHTPHDDSIQNVKNRDDFHVEGLW